MKFSDIFCWNSVCKNELNKFCGRQNVAEQVPVQLQTETQYNTKIQYNNSKDAAQWRLDFLFYQFWTALLWWPWPGWLRNYTHTYTLSCVHGLICKVEVNYRRTQQEVQLFYNTFPFSLIGNVLAFAFITVCMTCISDLFTLLLFNWVLGIFSPLDLETSSASCNISHIVMFLSYIIDFDI